MGSKERALWEPVIADASTLVEDSLTMLTNRRNQMLRQQEELTRLKDVSSSHIQKLLETCEEERSHYQQKMLSIKPSIRLMERQTELLEEVLDPERLQKVIDDSAKGMLTAKSTIGILKSMRQFFFSVDKIMIDFCREAELSNKMAISIYEKYQSEYGLEEFNPRRLTAKRFRSELQSLFKDADQFTSHLQLALTGQHQIVTRFFNTTVFNISEFFEKTRTRLNNWTDNVLHPLLHQINDHKRVLDHHLEELKSIQRSGASAASRLSALKLVLSDLDSEFEQCQTTLDILNQFKPNDERSTILDFRRRLNEETHA